MHIHAELRSVNLDMQRGILICEYINLETHSIYIVLCVYARIVCVCILHMHALEYLNHILEHEMANVFENDFPEKENSNAYMNSQITQ